MDVLLVMAAQDRKLIARRKIAFLVPEQDLSNTYRQVQKVFIDRDHAKNFKITLRISRNTVGAGPAACVDQILHLPTLSRSNAYTHADSAFSLAYGVPSTNVPVGDLP